LLSEKKYLFTFFFLLFSISLIKLIDNAINLDAWEYGEWLINYQNGFIRRGLIGEIIITFSNFSKINIQYSFVTILTIISAFYFYKCYSLFKKIKLNIVNVFILFSPIFFLFFILVNGVGIRKEIILYFYYLCFLTDIIYKKQNQKIYDYYLFLFPFLFLIHESFFFYLPYLFLPLIAISSKKNIKKLLFKFVIITLFSILIVLLLYNFRGTFEHTLKICESLGSYAPVRCTEWGPTYALQHDLLKDQTNQDMSFFYLQADVKSWIGYIIYIFYAIFPIILFLKSGSINHSYLKNKYFNYLLIFIFIWSLPLFHVAEDWSRWFSIHYHLLAFFLIFLINLKKYKFKFSEKVKKLNSLFLSKKNTFIFLGIIYSTLLAHEEYFAKDVDLKISILQIIERFY
jgi:hypothetical protein